MQFNQTRRAVRALLSLSAGLCLFPATSPGPVYMKFDGVDGEATDKEHKDWILIESINGGGLRDVVTSSQPTGKRQHKPFVVTKPLDKATPLLMDLLAGGGTAPEVVLEATRGGGAPGVPYYQIRMKDVRVGSIDLAAGGDEPPSETLSLEFPYAEWFYRQIGPDGAVIDRASAFFDAELNVAGPVNQGPRIGQAGNLDAVSGGSFAVEISVVDFDTDYLALDVEVDSDPAAATIGPIRWMAPESLRISGTASPTYRGQTTIVLRVSDGTSTASMAFSLFIDSTGSPWEGFMQAYFTEQERLDPLLASPIGDPDADGLATLLEFLLGTNPREFTPPELQRQVTPVRVATAGPPDDGNRIEIRFQRRVDEPLIRLALLGSPDGQTWTPLSRDGSNPLYEESGKTGENPLYEDVTGTVNPPEGAPGYFVRFVAEMN